VPSSVLLETDLGPYAPAVQWLETRLWIKDKRGRRRPLILNTPQRRYLRAKAAAIAAGKKPHFLVLKSRRTGITTLEQALSFELTSLHPHQNAITLAHDIESTKKIFEISRFFHRNLTGGDDAKGSAREFRFFGGDSLFWIGTAGTKSFGRGQTLQRVHWSESAHTPGQLDEIENLLVGLTEACSHGEMVLETTANGASGLFYRMWCEASQGESNFTPIFIPWWWDEGNVVRLPDAGLAEIEASLTVAERQLVDAHGLSLQQIAWRRSKRVELKGKFPQEYPENDVDAFLRSGHCFFDVNRLALLSGYCKKPVRTLLGGRLTVWEEPRKGTRYVIGIDAAEGVPGGDRSAACILNYETGEQAARLWGYLRPPEFGRLVVKLGRAYGWAHLVPEVNNHGHSVLNTITLQERYPTSRIYHQLRFDHDRRKRSPKLGWETNARTRPQLLDALCESIDEDGMGIYDREFLAECRCFNLQKNGRYEADDGEHDDLVIAWGLANYARLTRLSVTQMPRQVARRQGEERGVELLP
jgi:hypothetical protein